MPRSVASEGSREPAERVRKQGRDVGRSAIEKCHPSGQMVVTWQGRDCQ